MYGNQTTAGYAQTDTAWAGECAAQIQPALVHGTIKSLGELLSQLEVTNGTLVETRQRLFGAWPTNGVGASNVKEAPNGQAADLQDLIQRLHYMAGQVRENAISLGSAL